MADGFVQLTPEGTGPKTDSDNFTRGADAIKIPRVQATLGVPTHIGSAIGSVAGAGKNHAGLFNTTASTVRVWCVYVEPHITAAITGLKCSFYLLRTTTGGVGTNGFKDRTRLLDSASLGGITLLHSYTTQPTVTANSYLGSCTQMPEETSSAAISSFLWNGFMFEGMPLYLETNQGLVVQQAATQAGAGNFSFFFLWSEV